MSFIIISKFCKIFKKFKICVNKLVEETSLQEVVGGNVVENFTLHKKPGSSNIYFLSLELPEIFSATGRSTKLFHKLSRMRYIMF